MSTIEIEVAAPSSSRRQNAYETLLYAIVFGDLAPGARLDEKSLAHDFDIGIARVRDALFRLALERLVIRQPRTGTIVAGLDVQELHDVFEARIMLECQCAGLAALRADAHDIATMRKLADEFLGIAEMRDFRMLFKLDQTFHRAVARSTKNRILEQQVVVLHNNASRFWYAVSVARMDDEAWTKSRQSHANVVDGIASRDPKKAEAAMRESISPDFIDYYLRNRGVSELSLARRP